MFSPSTFESVPLSKAASQVSAPAHATACGAVFVESDCHRTLILDEEGCSINLPMRQSAIACSSFMVNSKPEMQSLDTASGIIAESIRLLAGRPIVEQDYFNRLCDGRMIRDEFVRSQQQFFFAVQFFSRPIAALVSRCVDSTLRMDLVHNLAEEQGEFRPNEAHDQTFKQFLSLLAPCEMVDVREEAPVRAFNAALMGACLTADRDQAFACLGFIEFAFADISALIGEAVVKRGWVASGQLVHYKLHAEIDKRHAAEFFAVIEPAWREGGVQRQRIEQGLAFGHYIFGRLYDDLSIP